MTLTTTELRAGEPDPGIPGPLDGDAEASSAPEARLVTEGVETSAPSPVATSFAVFLAVAAAGWMVGGIFQGLLPRFVGVGGALIGCGSVALSFRTRRPSAVQYLGIVAAVVVGVALVAPDAGGGSANLPGLVTEALRTGGLANPPVPFDPGWRFILVVVMALFGGGAASLSIALRQPKLGIFVPLPLVLAAALVQPAKTPVYLTAIGIVLIPAALTVSHGVELARDGSTSGRFEVRRLARSAGIVVVMLAALIILGQLGLLAPSSSQTQVVPPQRPQQPPPQADRVLFTVESARELTWRLGALDGYDGKGWLLPPYDPAGLVDFTDRDGVRVPDPDDFTVPVPRTAETIEATFTVSDIAGHVLPSLAGLLSVDGADGALRLEPRSETLRLPDRRVPSGYRYTIRAIVPPGGAQLAAAGVPPESMREFLDVPAPPPEVVRLLAKAPQNLYDRLQYVRNAYYKNVVASGGGKPVDVPPSRVVEMMSGVDASPYEITAGEVLLARWAGIPARIGFGYYSGQRPPGKNSVFEVRPRNGATWLEASFSGYGWVPFVGVPPKAKGSLSDDEKKKNPAVTASANLALTTYIPVRVTSVKLFFEIVRYWLVRVVPLLLLLGVVGWLYPGALKAVRSLRRRRWARGRAPVDALLVAYAEFRDAAEDLNVGDVADSPLEFVRNMTSDAEHDELAWLVARAFWGDLQRDLRARDAEAGAVMARNLTRRLRRAQTPTTRLLALGARASLRRPYTSTIPNLWTERFIRRAAGALCRPLRPVGSWLGRLLPSGRRTSAVNGVLLLMSVLLVSCSSGGDVVAASGELPTLIAPPRIGSLTFAREPRLEAAYGKLPSNALIDAGQALTVREGGAVKGSLQVARFKTELLRTKQDIDELRNGVITGLGTGRFEIERVGSIIMLTQSQPEQDLLLWFPPDTAYFELMVASKQFTDAREVFAQILLAQRGIAPGAAASSVVQEPDPRRGGVL